MSDFRLAPGFEDVWRPPVGRRRSPEEMLGRAAGVGSDPRSRLSRLARRAPEVMVKVTGRTRDPGHLQAHLDYISRNAELELEGPFGARLTSPAELRDLVDDWSFAALRDPRTRANSPLSLSVVLSMPKSTDPLAVRDAAAEFAERTFGGRFDYVFVLHTDASHPHVHLTVAARGERGQRLNPKKADLEAWRQTFAEALRARGVEAEATPRRARGVTRKAERGPLRRIRERRERGGPVGRITRAAYLAAAQRAVDKASAGAAWEDAIARRQQRVRTLYLAQARILRTTGEAADIELAQAVEHFVTAMPAVETLQQRIVRELRMASNRGESERRPPGPERTR